MLTALSARLRDLLVRLVGSPNVRRLLKNTSYLFSATGISALLSLLQGILTARLLGVAGYGTLGAVITFASVVNRFVSFRMSELVVKYVGEYTERNDGERAAAVFKAAALAEMAASCAAFVLICLLAPLGARYLAKDESAANLFVVYGLVVLVNLISESSTGLLQIFDRFRRMAALNVVQGGVTLALTAAAFAGHGSLLAVLLCYLAGKTVAAVAMTAAALQEASHRWGKRWWHTPLDLLRPRWGELVHFAISTNISASLSLINKDSELLFVSFFRTPEETGYYRLALTMANLVQLPISPLQQATYPELSRETARQNWPSVRHVLRQGSRLAGGYTLAAAAFLVIFGRPLIRILYDPEFLPAYPALVILLTGLLVANTFYWHRTLLLSLGRPDFPTKVNLVLAVLKVAGIVWLVPVYGYLANAALLAGSYILGVSVSAWVAVRTIARREAGVRPMV